MAEPLQLDLTDSQRFEQERMLRAIDKTTDIEVLREVAKQYVRGFMVQRAAANWLIRQNMTPIPDYRPATISGISDPAPEPGVG